MTRSQSRERLYSVRKSPIHGKGVFALRPIPKGTRIVEYRGARFSTEEAAEVYARTMEYPFTYQFAVDADTVIDASIKRKLGKVHQPFLCAQLRVRSKRMAESSSRPSVQSPPERNCCMTIAFGSMGERPSSSRTPFAALAGRLHVAGPCC